ncbi:MAG: RelA/SpoT family protein, partial [Actinomycetota bacterium]
MAEAAHTGQKRISGEDFVEHPLAVANVLAELHLDTTTLVASLLHDVVEDTDVSLEQLERDFGPEISAIVDGLTKLDKITFRTREQEQAENVRKMVVAMAGDIRVLLIKLADRLHNMRTISVLPQMKQAEKATETLEIYAPLAHRLGVDRIKWELEDLSFKTLHPGPYREIAALVEKRRGERQEYIDGVLAEARSQLREVGVKAEVEGRPKHLYSIYEKMVLRGKEFNEIYDLVGVRILVESVRDCYGALGAVHSLWKPIPGRFKDYVAMPKFNMYQSLHTTVVGPQGKPLEIQIRSRDMHRTAEYGIAAHWRYKEGKQKGKDTSDLAWLGQMLEWLQDMRDPREFMEGLRIDLYGGQVFVFTPKGDVVSLPAGSTPIDLAYAIHTEVGHRCIGAKVAGKLVPLDYELRTGDKVEVLTSRARDASPSLDWLQFVKSPRARNKIRQWFSRERREDMLEVGREALQTLMRKQNVPFKRLATDEALEQVAGELGYPNLDALSVAVGEGHVSPQSVVARLSRLLSGASEEDALDVPLARPVRISDGRAAAQGVVVQGSTDVWVRLARCCTPVPGDEIMGFVSRGQGVSVHRADCPNAKALSREPERLIDVSWAEGKPTSFV